MKNKTFVVDIDDTLLLYPNKKYDDVFDKYNDAYANQKEIDLLNKLYNDGYTILLLTGRNWDKYFFTVKQLKKFKIKYHQLIMGKPQGCYVDRDSYKSLKEAIN